MLHCKACHPAHLCLGRLKVGQGDRIVKLDGSGEVVTTVRSLLVDVLGLPKSRVAGFGDDTELFGALPEFDSMAVANFLTEMEERLGILIEDDEVEAEDFMTYGRLLHFVRRKTA